MPGKQTALTARLEPSKRQFFQWHKVEQRPISEVKRRMDELTEALNSADYKYDFVAEKESWKSRSRHWNKDAKDRWMVETNQKGRVLPIPKKLANVPVWIEWDQDVWDWRNQKRGRKDPTISLAAQADTNEENYWNTGHWEGQYQNSAVIGEDGAFQGSHASLSPRLSTNSRLSHSDLTMNPGITLPYFNTQNIPWLQQPFIPFTTIPLPSLPELEQAHYALQDYNRGPNMYYQDCQTATPASNAILPASNSIHGKEQELVSYMSEMETSYMTETSNIGEVQPFHVPVPNWPQQNSASTVQDYTSKDKTSYPKDKAQQFSETDLHDRHRSTFSLATGQALRLQELGRTTSRLEGSQYDSGLWQGANGL